jgi:hypothetical protein
MLDVTGGSGLSIASSGSDVTVTWPAIPGTLEDTPSLNPTDWQSVTGTPTLTTNGYTLTLPLGPGEQYFRLSQ